MEVVWQRGARAGTGVPGRHGMVPGGHHLPLQGHGQEGGGEGCGHVKRVWSCDLEGGVEGAWSCEY